MKKVLNVEEVKDERRDVKKELKKAAKYSSLPEGEFAEKMKQVE